MKKKKSFPKETQHVFWMLGNLVVYNVDYLKNLVERVYKENLDEIYDFKKYLLEDLKKKTIKNNPGKEVDYVEKKLDVLSFDFECALFQLLLESKTKEKFESLLEETTTHKNIHFILDIFAIEYEKKNEKIEKFKGFIFSTFKKEGINAFDNYLRICEAMPSFKNASICFTKEDFYILVMNDNPLYPQSWSNIKDVENCFGIDNKKDDKSLDLKLIASKLKPNKLIAKIEDKINFIQKSQVKNLKLNPKFYRLDSENMVVEIPANIKNIKPIEFLIVIVFQAGFKNIITQKSAEEFMELINEADKQINKDWQITSLKKFLDKKCNDSFLSKEISQERMKIIKSLLLKKEIEINSKKSNIDKVDKQTPGFKI